MTIYDHWLYRFLTGPLNNVAWLYILLPCVFAGGIYLTVGSGAVQFRRFGYAMKNTAGKLFKKQETAHGAITPLQAVTTALAATVHRVRKRRKNCARLRTMKSPRRWRKPSARAVSCVVKAMRNRQNCLPTRSARIRASIPLFVACAPMRRASRAIRMSWS